jgi:hypothetical protein
MCPRCPCPQSTALAVMEWIDSGFVERRWTSRQTMEASMRLRSAPTVDGRRSPNWISLDGDERTGRPHPHRYCQLYPDRSRATQSPGLGNFTRKSECSPTSLRAVTRHTCSCVRMSNSMDSLATESWTEDVAASGRNKIPPSFAHPRVLYPLDE